MMTRGDSIGRIGARRRMVSRGVWIAAIGALLIVGLPIGCGDEVRYSEQSGVTYQETRRDAEPRLASQQTRVAPDSGVRQPWQPAAPGQPAMQTQEMVHTYWVPVAEYRWEPYWVNRWNPFAEPHLAYRYVAHTRWEQRSEIVRVPVVARRDLLPGTAPAVGPSWPAPPQTHVSRVPVAGQNASGRAYPAAPAPAETPLTAHRESFGGIGRVGDEPPR
jgi:hypothetical protein